MLCNLNFSIFSMGINLERGRWGRVAVANMGGRKDIIILSNQVWLASLNFEMKLVNGSRKAVAVEQPADRNDYHELQLPGA
jgi:hypothetical protein